MKEITTPARKEWILTTYDNEEYSMSEKEYQFFKEASKHPELKFIHFGNELTIAIGDIRRVEAKETPEKKGWVRDVED